MASNTLICPWSVFCCQQPVWLQNSRHLPFSFGCFFVVCLFGWFLGFFLVFFVVVLVVVLLVWFGLVFFCLFCVFCLSTNFSFQSSFSLTVCPPCLPSLALFTFKAI